MISFNEDRTITPRPIILYAFILIGILAAIVLIPY